VNYCQIDSCDHYSDHLNLEAVSPKMGSYFADVVVVVALAVTETENAETAVRMGPDYSVGHLN
jgi:hypothetical protein